METASVNAAMTGGAVDAPEEATASHFTEHRWVRWAKFAVDLLALQLALFAAEELTAIPHSWGRGTVPPDLYIEVSLALLLLPCWLLLAGLYPGYGLALAERLRRRVRITFMFFMVFSLWRFYVHHDIYSRMFTALLFPLALVLPPMLQHLLRGVLTRKNLWGTPVLIVGARYTGTRVVASLLENPDLGLRPVAILDDDPAKWGTTLSGIRVEGGVNRAASYRGKLNYALVASPRLPRDEQVHLVNHLPFPHVLIIPDLIGVQSLWVEARDLCGMVGLEIRKNLLVRSNMYLKLLMDYLLGVPIFLMSLPLLGFFAVWIFAVTRVNPFYFQVREGRGGKDFKVWKLRTMYPDADKLLQQHLANDPEARKEWDTYFKLKDDPRILKGVGHFLRKSSIDEIPQLWNVLRGEMSLVGPRPFPHYHLEQFEQEFRQVRRQVLPGMTGLWQVSARSDGDLAVQERLDGYYILNWSIWLDLSLLCHTIQTVLLGKGAY
jgi:Undecaprenyl-phosphate galactose phosphotransferase WbaP